MVVTVLAEVQPVGVEPYLDVFSDEGLRKRAEHGCRGTRLPAPLGEDGVGLVLLEFVSVEAFEGFRSRGGATDHAQGRRTGPADLPGSHRGGVLDS